MKTDLDARIEEAAHEVRLLDRARQIVHGTQNLRKIRAVEEAHANAVQALGRLIKKRRAAQGVSATSTASPAEGVS